MGYEKGISVIIPVYNTEFFISRCLDSVLSQTYKDLEVICVLDKKSDDKSNVILDYYAKKDKRVKIIKDTTGKGQGYNRNLGIEAATKEYIGFVDSDDFIEKTFYQQLDSNFKHFPLIFKYFHPFSTEAGISARDGARTVFFFIKFESC